MNNHAPTPPPPFSPYFAFGICVLYFVLLNVVQLMALWLVGSFFYETHDVSQLIQSSSKNGLVIAYSVFLTALFFIIISPLLIYYRTKNTQVVKNFFAIRHFSMRHLGHGVMLLVVVLAISEFLNQLLGKNHLLFLDGLINKDNQLLLTIAIVIISPIYEEILFRGMMYGAIAHITLNHGTTLHTLSHYQWAGLFISSILFTYVHLQYDWFGMVIIFCLALLFGYVRIKYGLLLAIVLHIINNAIAMTDYLYF